jgi:hypothetical protein
MSSRSSHHAKSSRSSHHSEVLIAHSSLWPGGQAINFEGGISPSLSTMGFSYAFPTASNDWHTRHPAQPVIESESSSMTGDRGVYVDDDDAGHVNGYDRQGYDRQHGHAAAYSSGPPRRGRFSRRVGVRNWGTSAEETWQQVRGMNYTQGAFVWTVLYIICEQFMCGRYCILYVYSSCVDGTVYYM